VWSLYGRDSRAAGDGVRGAGSGAVPGERGGGEGISAGQGGCLMAACRAADPACPAGR